MNFELEGFTIKNIVECGRALRKKGDGARSMQETAQRIVGLLRTRLTASDSAQSACILVRFFKTHRFDKLPGNLQRFVQESFGSPADASTRCLTLLVSSGDLPEWNDPRMSRGHKAIPLASPEAVAQCPMISQIARQLGLDVTGIAAESPYLMEAQQRAYNVLYVPEAEGNLAIPAQEEFVKKFGVKSVLGVGGILPSGDVFVTMLFTRVPVSRSTALAFKPLALNMKIALLPFDGEQIFAEQEAVAHGR